jgi:hypothetical protein
MAEGGFRLTRFTPQRRGATESGWAVGIAAAPRDARAEPPPCPSR